MATVVARPIGALSSLEFADQVAGVGHLALQRSWCSGLWRHLQPTATSFGLRVSPPARFGCTDDRVRRAVWWPSPSPTPCPSGLSLWPGPAGAAWRPQSHLYTAPRQIGPTMDTGVDFAAEYKAAMEMQAK